MDFESNLLTSHICLSECMPEVISAMYKGMGMKINSKEMEETTKKVFNESMQGQEPAQCLLTVLFILRELYRQIGDTKISDKNLSEDFLKMIGKRRQSPMYG
jgi:hypothetical protein